MERMNRYLDKMVAGANKLQQNKYMNSIMEGLMSSTSLLMIGSIFSILNSLPIKSYQNFITNQGLKVFLSIPANITVNLLSLYLVFAIAYNFTVKSNRKESVEVGFLALMSFFILTPFEIDNTFTISSLPTQWFGSIGLFSGFVVALLVGKICVSLYDKNIVIKMPEGVPSAISKSFSALIPGFIVAILSLAFRLFFAKTPFGSLHQMIYGLIGLPLSKIGTSFWAFLLFVILIHVFWFIGIHGSMVVLGVAAPVLMPLELENLAAFNAGTAIPNILTPGFLFQSIGAVAGSTLGLVILMLFSKSERYKTMGKLGIIPGIFSINEPILFGTPLIMNFQLAIPFILTPVLNFIGAYLLTKVGFLPFVNGVSVPVGTPIAIGGFMIGGFKWAIYQLFTVVLSLIMYFPFFKKLDNEEYKKEQAEKKKA